MAGKSSQVSRFEDDKERARASVPDSIHKNSVLDAFFAKSDDPSINNANKVHVKEVGIISKLSKLKEFEIKVDPAAQKRNTKTADVKKVRDKSHANVRSVAKRNIDALRSMEGVKRSM